MVRNKRGWLRILEATIAVLLVSGVMLFVYSRGIEENTGAVDYIESLQKQILGDISLRSDLRGYVLSESGSYLVLLEDYVSLRIPGAFGHKLRVCDLGDSCKLDSVMFSETLDKNVYVDEVIISADFGDYSPKKVRLFVWENN